MTDKHSCQACAGRGWYYFNAGNHELPRYEVQRCDVCEKYLSDLAALEAVEKADQTQPALLGFAERISRLTHEGEPGADGQPCEPTSEDAIATLNQLILQARQLLGTADQCDECKETVPYVIGCPDGAEVCRDCFEAGQQ